ncbi:BTB/POZ and MATH domain-containing protein 2 [Hordeum vulgare]|nr:BTB/POZ and MATH domain-containing protein 2 [Hordeum vulgare]
MRGVSGWQAPSSKDSSMAEVDDQTARWNDMADFWVWLRIDDLRRIPSRKLLFVEEPSLFMAQFLSMKETGAGATPCAQMISGMEPRVFQAMLHFIYTDSLPENIDDQGETTAMEMAQRLLLAAHRASRPSYGVTDFENLKTAHPNILEELVANAVDAPKAFSIRCDVDVAMGFRTQPTTQLVTVPTCGMAHQFGHILETGDGAEVIFEDTVDLHKRVVQLHRHGGNYTLAFAEQHGFDGLKKACFKFLASFSNLKAVRATDGFKKLKDIHPNILEELIVQG